MHLDHYETLASASSFEYIFSSVGKSSETIILIQYTLVQQGTAANLGFGRLRPNGTVDDTYRTNNNDMEKILATVAQTVIDFTNENPDIPVIAKGSTPSRTRLYRTMIQRNYSEISQFFIVLGYFNEQWIAFKPDLDYQAFLVKRKINTIFERIENGK